MKATEYKAILSAVEEALKICESYGDMMDDVKRKICAELRGVRDELRHQLGLASPEST